jgi:quinohemoprotein ethanol dehydrogenase
VYILDRTNGKPLIGMEERPVPQEPHQHTAKTQPYPIGDAVVPQCAQPLDGYEKAGCIFEAFWEEPVLIQPSGVGGTNWAPMSYSPETGDFYVPATIRTSAFVRYDTKYMKGQRYDGGTQAAPIGSTMSGTFTAIGGHTNKIVWQYKAPYRIGQGSGSTTTAGGLVFHGEPDGNFVAFDAKTGEELWRFQTGYGADAGPMVYEVDGEEFVAIPTGGNQGMLSKNGDAVWAFSLNGHLGPQLGPPPPQKVAGPAGPLRDDVSEVKMGANNMEYVYSPGRTKIKAGATLTFTNAGDTPHTATSFETGKVGAWDTGPLNPGDSKKITFDKPGTYYYICTPHPWMYGQIVVE